MRAAAPLAFSGLIALILAEIMKYILPPLLGWTGAILLVVVKALFMIAAVSFAVLAIGASIFIGRWILRRQETSRGF